MLKNERFSEIFRKLELGNECTKCIIKELRIRNLIIENGLEEQDLANDITMPENQE